MAPPSTTAARSWPSEMRPVAKPMLLRIRRLGVRISSGVLHRTALELRERGSGPFLFLKWIWARTRSVLRFRQLARFARSGCAFQCPAGSALVRRLFCAGRGPGLDAVLRL